MCGLVTRVAAVSRVDLIWRATEPLGMRAGTETALSQATLTRLAGISPFRFAQASFQRIVLLFKFDSLDSQRGGKQASERDCGKVWSCGFVERSTLYCDVVSFSFLSRD